MRAAFMLKLFLCSFINGSSMVRNAGLRDESFLRVRARRAAIGPVPAGHVHIRSGRWEDRDAAEEGRAAALARVGAGQGRPSRYRIGTQQTFFGLEINN